MGKWSKHKGKLPAFVQPPDYALKVDAAKRVLGLGALDRNKLAVVFVRIKQEKEEAEAILSGINVRLEATQQELVDRLEEADEASVRLTDGTSVFMRDEPYCSLDPAPEVRLKFYEWVRKSRLDGLLSMHYKTLSGLVKKYLEDGVKVPPGVNVFMKTTVQVRSGKNPTTKEQHDGDTAEATL